MPATFICPQCGIVVEVESNTVDHCPKCGTAINTMAHTHLKMSITCEKLQQAIVYLQVRGIGIGQITWGILFILGSLPFSKIWATADTVSIYILMGATGIGLVYIVQGIRLITHPSRGGFRAAIVTVFITALLTLLALPLLSWLLMAYAFIQLKYYRLYGHRTILRPTRASLGYAQMQLSRLRTLGPAKSLDIIEFEPAEWSGVLGHQFMVHRWRILLLNNMLLIRLYRTDYYCRYPRQEVRCIPQETVTIASKGKALFGDELKCTLSIHDSSPIVVNGLISEESLHRYQAWKKQYEMACDSEE